MPYPQFSDAKTSLAARLADPNNLFWSNTELGLYIFEALRTWNALTEIWVVNFPFNAVANQVWYDISALVNSPRPRTVTDVQLYTMMEYHLLEPPTGGTWTGTSQFALSDLSQALQRRRDEMIQTTACNVALFSGIPSVPGNTRATYPYQVLEPIRQRFLPATGFGSPVTLTREDTAAFDAFDPFHNQFGGIPSSFSVISEPPKSFDVDVPPNVPGQYDCIAVQQGPIFNPPGPTLLGVPDDWSWLAKWGALADLLSRDSEATDRARADYCFKRYQQGLKIMQASNWLLAATTANVPVDTPSVKEKDGFAPEWQDDTNAWPTVVVAGIDLVAPCPVGTASTSLNVVGNAPLPTLNNDPVQVMQDAYDTILDYAQVLASFKMGGSEFAATKDLEAKFFDYAQQFNKRLANLGLFSDMLHLEGKRQLINQPR